jgi:hypothetical protein
MAPLLILELFLELMCWSQGITVKNITVFQKFGCELLNGCTNLKVVQNDKGRRIVLGPKYLS